MKGENTQREASGAEAPSLAQRLGRSARARMAGLASVEADVARQGAPSERWVAFLVALLIALGPLLTIAGAKLLEARANAAASRLEAQLSPRIAAAQAREIAQRELADVLRQPSVGATLEALARALPPGAALMRVERSAANGLEIDVATADPDALRQALRRSPGLAGLRNIGQRQGDAGMLVTFRVGGE